MPTQKEMISQILQKQEKQGKLLTEMDIALRGPNYDPNDGGLLEQVHTNTSDLNSMRKKQQKIITWGVTIFGAINILGVILVIITRFKDVLP